MKKINYFYPFTRKAIFRAQEVHSQCRFHLESVLPNLCTCQTVIVGCGGYFDGGRGRGGCEWVVRLMSAKVRSAVFIYFCRNSFSLIVWGKKNQNGPTNNITILKIKRKYNNRTWKFGMISFKKYLNKN